MESLASAVKIILLWPILALIEVPLVRLSTRLLKFRVPSFGGTYLLVLLTGAFCAAAQFLVSILLPGLSELAETIVSIFVALLVCGWVFGYFLVTVEGKAVGHIKGLLVFSMASVMFAVLLVAFALIVVGV